MEAAVPAPAECHSLPVCILGGVWSNFVHKHGGSMEKYVFCTAQNCQNEVLRVRRLLWVLEPVLISIDSDWVYSLKCISEMILGDV